MQLGFLLELQSFSAVFALKALKQNLMHLSLVVGAQKLILTQIITLFRAPVNTPYMMIVDQPAIKVVVFSSTTPIDPHFGTFACNAITLGYRISLVGTALTPVAHS
jgi:hypothetical protein